MNRTFIRKLTVMSFITSFSRVLGYIRDFLFAFIIGAGTVADSFLLAFRIPNFFRRLFAEGSINNAFIPMYLEIKKRNGEKKAELFVGKFISMLLIFLVILVGVMELFILQIVSFLAPGFDSDLLEKTSFLASIMMPYLILISISSLIGATLNAHGRYALWSFSPIILNLIMIAGMCYAVYSNFITEVVLAWSVMISGFIQFFVLLFWVRLKKIRIVFLFPSLSNNIKSLLKLLIPNFLAGGVIQINQFVGLYFASSITGAISWLYYSDRIVQLPLGIFVISISTILLTSLSKSKYDKEKFVSNINSSYILMLSITFLCTVILIAIPELIVDILFKRGKFGYGDVKATSDALVMYALGLPAFGLIKLFSTIFFSAKNTRFPFYISFFSMLVNILLINFLIDGFGHTGIALALSVSSWISVILLYLGLKIKNYWRMNVDLMLSLFKLVFISFFTFVVLYLSYFLTIYYDFIMLSNLYKKIILLACLVSLATFSFFTFSIFFKVLKIQDIKGKLFKK